MANDFSKEERVNFEEVLEGFNDALVASKAAKVYKTGQTDMVRAGDVMWRPSPYILDSNSSGMTQTGNFVDRTQLSVPTSISLKHTVPLIMDARELNDAVQEKRLGEGAKQRLASDLNVDVLNAACTYGSLVVPVAADASGFDDVAKVEAIMNEQGVQNYDRKLFLSTRDYNGMASNLADRGTVTGKVLTAYERAQVGLLASFDTYKLDYANRISAAAGTGDTFDNRTVTALYHVPAATATGTTGVNNVDNRFQTITVNNTTNVVAGDAMTIAGINAVHAITKQDTGQLKTFRIIAVPSATTLTITPPIISAQGATTAEKQYQNCVVNTESSTAAIVYLNKKAAAINPFWFKDSIEIIPGKYQVPDGAGASVLRGSTDQGIEMVMTKQFDIDTMKIKFRFDLLYGVTNLAPEMSGILIFGQT